jgi:type I phosphodiesterase/nucleotide pyrophosphatase
MTRITALAAAAALAAVAAMRLHAATPPACTFANGVQHVVFLQFDNTHYRRDDPNVASDLEQMPHLLDFLTQHGTLFTNDHTVLISHTAAGFVSTLTGLYPDRNGLTVTNSYDYFAPGGTPVSTSAFKYWTAPVDGPGDPLPNLVTAGGKTTPAPWVPFTRAGCDVGAVGIPDVVQESGPDAGVAIHCAQTPASKCAGNAEAQPDPLPDEPGGYSGYQALFSAGGGFDAQSTLRDVEQMQESGVPVTFGYISDAHGALGPGEAGYVARLQATDAAFASFFDGLAAHGIDKSNTVFVVTVDEGDHFAGGSGPPYSHTTCTDLPKCPANQLGELDVNLPALLPAGEPAFDLHADSAPAIYVAGQPARTNRAVRKLERDIARLTSYDPYEGRTVGLVARLADAVEERTLHMTNADPRRTPTFTVFGNADFWFQASDCAGVHVCASPAFAWNHGDVQDEIGATWLGLVGPGVHSGGIDFRTWTDHTNVRPTLLALLGLRDDYVHDGHVLVEALEPQALPPGLAAHTVTARRLGAVYEQVNAPFGQFAMSTLATSTRALTSGNERRYASLESGLAKLTSQRNALATTIKDALDAAAFHGKALDVRRANHWIAESYAVISHALALRLLHAERIP